MHNPEITFIIPVYKVDYSLLKRCITSVMAQGHQEGQMEVILIDDGSPDECGAICDSFAKLYSEIRVIHQTNQGLAVVRNVGVQNATGTWVAFIDGDDWIEPDTFECVTKLIKEVPDDADMILWDGYSETRKASTPIRFFDTSEPYLMVFDGEEKEKVIDRILPRYVKRSDISRCASLGVTWARIYRKDMLIGHDVWNIPGLRLMQDSVFNLWAIENSRKICYKFMPLYHYSMYDESISKKQDGTVAESVLQLYGYYSEYVLKCHDSEVFWQRLYIRTVRMLVKCLSKDYANPLNKAPIRERINKMKTDLSAPEFQTALQKCDPTGQDIKFRIILFQLKHKLYFLSILTSSLFFKLRSIRQ